MEFYDWIKEKHPHQWLRSKSLSKYRKDKWDRANLRNKNFTIFLSNCIGGIIYHGLGQKFLSPTINLYIKPKDYVEMLANPQKYFIPGKMKEVKQTKHKYPVGEINSRKIYGVHYDSFKQLKKKWDIRCQRINWNNVYIFMIERDGCTYSDLENFDKLPYVNKVVFTRKKYPNIKGSFVIPGTLDKKNDNVNDLCGYHNFFSGIRTIDEFSYLDFINDGKLGLTKYNKKIL